MIFISTGGQKNQTASQACRYFEKSGILNIELSGGLFAERQLSELIRLKRNLSFQIHNYFPPPKDPFVFNLASLDPVVSSRSFEHVINAMQWSVELSRPIFSFHAGFLLDPQVNELGRRVSKKTLFSREESLLRFIERVNNLAEIAKSLGVKLLIENNVLSLNNYVEFGSDPFLMTSASECIRVMRSVPKNVQLLIDVAHLKVSSNVLSFDPVQFLSECDPWIGGYHLSDNDGTRDSNESIAVNSWFWPHLKSNLDYYSLEVYGLHPDELFKQLKLAEAKLEMPNARP